MSVELMSKIFSQYWPMFLRGAAATLMISLTATILGCLIGLLIGVVRTTPTPERGAKRGILRALNGIFSVYIEFFRGTPMIVQAMFIYFGITGATGINMSAYTAGLITLALNAGAYISEIFRGGIQSVSPGQMEAARSLGLSHSMSMVRVVLPQAIRMMIPALINQYIITLKDTSIISVIGVRELTQSGKLIIASNFRSAEIWFTVGFMYYVTVYILSKIGRLIERRMSYVQSKNK